MLELRDVSMLVGGVYHTRNVSMKLERGSLNVLLGPTLSGKTSLMRLMAGLDKPTSGQILVEGKDVTGLSVRKRDVAMVYQQFINYPALTVYENIASPMRVEGKSKSYIDKEVRRAADLLKLTPYLDRTPLNMSGGQQQRTALARALVKGAHLVLMDEPLANLDYKLREELRAELPKIFAEAGSVFVYATTEPSEALLLGGSTATLHHGYVSQFGSTLGVYSNPQDLVTAQTFSDPPLNTLSAVKKDNSFVLSSGRRISVTPAQMSLPDGKYTIGIRPHQLYMRAPNENAVSLGAHVVVSEITGSESFIHLDCLGERWVALTHGIHNHEQGEEVHIFVDANTFLLFDENGKRAAPALQAA
ncbi:ABC transporter ATP-binding protein [Flexibacterium corallicola]|uniref:ABC transporter ATP-binding protein n=1 Tax=Flexibacterium corallicola TaxID=3037259 RepID=UPI00286F63E4|nr:ABC transporter ATP-binding protein [Pseudovibrio sp. M1P-2-3]